MFETIVQAVTEYPYLGIGLLFLLCGLGLPLPEELVLIAGGYICARFPEQASLPWMMVWCAVAILIGDLIPYLLGRTFGTRLLRLRWLRLLVTKQRLAKFDRWFRRRGDYVIFIARFLAGIRVVAFFTAGTMKMTFRRFLVLDGMGIVLIVPLLTWLGCQGAGVIDDVIATVQKIERGILWGTLAAAGVALVWFWIWRRRRRLAQAGTRRETFVEPRQPVAATAPEPPEPPPDPGASPPAGDPPPPTGG